MKDKFSIFSPPASKTSNDPSAINFKKSPQKFALYEPYLKPREAKPNVEKSLSSNNL